ncbi:tumor suppressor candidate 3 [Perkinsus olseni]|uniref:Tumor suppressor candidate 3 n=1 Tax=Perkinsus olseni TaxID=32597 RepID=A0A7J6LAI6_PEROL|nr:tumor suppressor candidate 3 [Perkinsus olseni]
MAHLNLVCLLLAWGLVDAAAKVDQPKIDQLADLTEDSHYNNFDLSAVIRLNITGYKEYALKQPKPYHIFIMFTANSGVCKVCPHLERSFDRASLSYYAIGAHHTADVDVDDDPVFFGMIDAYSNTELQRLHELKAVPLLVHFSHKSQLTKKKKSGTLAIKAADQFRISKYDHTPEDLLEWMNQKTGREVRVFKTPHERLSSALKMLFGAVLLVIVGIFGIYSARTWPITCAIVALCIEFVSMSGIFFNILQGMMMQGKDAQGNPEWIMQGMRGQYLGEGLAASFMMITSGVCMLIAVRLPSVKYFQGSKKASSIQLVSVAVSVLCMWAVFEMYAVKTGWAMSSTFYPPDTYKRGWVRADQGNTF